MGNRRYGNNVKVNPNSNFLVVITSFWSLKRVSLVFLPVDLSEATAVETFCKAKATWRGYFIHLKCKMALNPLEELFVD